MSEVNTKQISSNKEIIKNKLIKINRNIEFIIANSTDYVLTDNNWLPGWILSTFQRLIVSIIDQTKTVIDKLGKQSIYNITNGEKLIVIVTIY